MNLYSIMIKCMTKHFSKKGIALGNSLVLSALVLGTLLPGMASARTAGPPTEAFCSRISSAAEKTTTRINERITTVETRESDRLKQIATRQAAQDKKLAGERTTWDASREASYEKLLGKANTDLEKQAVNDFKTTISDAVTLRRSEVDKAIDTFRTGAEGVVTKHQEGVNQALKNFEQSVDAAFTKAKTDCTNSKDPQAIREALKASLKQARETLKSERSSLGDTRQAIEALKATRKQSVEQAVNTFNATAKTARETLKKAFQA